MEGLIKKAFIETTNTLITNKEELYADNDYFINEIESSTKLNDEVLAHKEKILEYEEILSSLISRKAKELSTDNEKKYDLFYKKYSKEVVLVNQKLLLIEENKLRSSKMKAILNTIRNQDNLINEFDRQLFGMIVNKVKVITKNELIFEYKDAMIIPWMN